MKVKASVLRNNIDQINEQLTVQMKEDLMNLKIMADEMIECATNIKGQGYCSFMASRERFFSSLEEMVNEYSYYVHKDKDSMSCK